MGPALVLAVARRLDRVLRQVVLAKHRICVWCVRVLEHHDERRNVRLAGQIQTEPAGLAQELIELEIGVGTGIPGAHVHPGRVSTHPFVEVLGLEVVDRTGQLHGLGLQGNQNLFTHRDAPVGVGFDERVLGCPVITFIESVDDSELGIVFEHPVEQLGDKASDLVANARSIAASRGDHP